MRPLRWQTLQCKLGACHDSIGTTGACCCIAEDILHAVRAFCARPSQAKSVEQSTRTGLTPKHAELAIARATDLRVGFSCALLRWGVILRRRGGGRHRLRPVEWRCRAHGCRLLRRPEHGRRRGGRLLRPVHRRRSAGAGAAHSTVDRRLRLGPVDRRRRSHAELRRGRACRKLRADAGGLRRPEDGGRRSTRLRSS